MSDHLHNDNDDKFRRKKNYVGPYSATVETSFFDCMPTVNLQEIISSRDIILPTEDIIITEDWLLDECVIQQILDKASHTSEQSVLDVLVCGLVKLVVRHKLELTDEDKGIILTNKNTSNTKELIDRVKCLIAKKNWEAMTKHPKSFEHIDIILKLDSSKKFTTIIKLDDYGWKPPKSRETDEYNAMDDWLKLLLSNDDNIPAMRIYEYVPDYVRDKLVTIRRVPLYQVLYFYVKSSKTMVDDSRQLSRRKLMVQIKSKLLKMLRRLKKLPRENINSNPIESLVWTTATRKLVWGYNMWFTYVDAAAPEVYRKMFMWRVQAKILKITSNEEYLEVSVPEDRSMNLV